MKDNVIKECTMNYKITIEGEDHVCDAVQQYAEKYAAKSYDNGRNEGSVNSLASLIISGNIPLDLAIKSSGLSRDEFFSTASRLGFNL